MRLKEGQDDIEITLSRYQFYAWGGKIFFVTGVSVDFHTFLRFDTCVACGFTTANYTPLFNVSG